MTIIDEIRQERERQITVEGWTLEHDDAHRSGEMADAAVCYAATKPAYYASNYTDEIGRTFRFGSLWPWGAKWWKPKDRRHNLIRAAALLVAEIERLDRAALQSKEGE